MILSLSEEEDELNLRKIRLEMAVLAEAGYTFNDWDTMDNETKTMLQKNIDSYTDKERPSETHGELKRKIEEIFDKSTALNELLSIAQHLHITGKHLRNIDLIINRLGRDHAASAAIAHGPMRSS